MEAIANGIQAIDARFGDDVGRGRLHVRILRSPQDELEFGSSGPGRTALKPIVGFSIEDNGVGFNWENMKSFETLDSGFKAAIGCRGVGRLLWLKAFDKVSIHSAYLNEEGELRRRQFKFSVEREIEQLEEPDGFDEPGTTVRLDGFKDAFRQSAPKGVVPINLKLND